MPFRTGTFHSSSGGENFFGPGGNTRGPPNSGLRSSVGMPATCADLAKPEHGIPLRDIKCYVQQAAPDAQQDWLQACFADGCTHPARQVVQALLHIARIKDIANTRGGAQVSQYRRALVSTSHDMLLQHLAHLVSAPDFASKCQEQVSPAPTRTQSVSPSVSPSESPKDLTVDNTETSTDSDSLRIAISLERIANTLTREQQDEPRVLESISEHGLRGLHADTISRQQSRAGTPQLPSNRGQP